MNSVQIKTEYKQLLEMAAAWEHFALAPLW
jgi:hypothetical protein